MLTQSGNDHDQPVLLVSGDSHVGPILETDLRPHCPTDRLDEFDRYASSPAVATARASFGPPTMLNRKTDGHFDAVARLADMDADGVAAEVIYHQSFNGEPIPFQDGGWPNPDHPELATLGFRIYNRWLAEFCAVAPERLIGLAHLPMWDLDAAIAELEWAADHGLRGVNFPASRPGWKQYNDPCWEPFWDAAEGRGMVLSTHAGGGIDPAAIEAFPSPLGILEAGGALNRRPIARMVIGGVFERHPNLKLAMTEQPGIWVPELLADMDSAQLALGMLNPQQLSRSPSEYFMDNVFVGASFIAPFETADAVDKGYWTNLFWGRDYPHPEGTWRYTEEPTDTRMTHLSLRHAFGAGVAEDIVRAIVGTNAIGVFGLDRDALEKIAASIGPTLGQITEPLPSVPAPDSEERQGMGLFSFRTVGAWA